MEVTEKEVCAYLRMGNEMPDAQLSKRIGELLAEVQPILRPSRIWQRVRVAEIPMLGNSLYQHLSSCEDAFLACGTLGAGIDAFQRRIAICSAADALIVLAIGAAFVERVMDGIEEAIKEELLPGESLVSRYSPGFGDFPLAAQRKILAMLDASRKIGVSLTDSLLLVPSKSVSAVIGVRRTEERLQE